MIISASYKTDIPTFYGEWFLNRLRAGYCKVVNPYGRQVYTVDLRAEAVEGFVFWTRNAAPFAKALAEVKARGFPFVVQYGITGYPRALERSLPEAGRSVERVRRLAEEYGPRAVVWRYDPIVFSSLTPADFHRATFERLAAGLRGAVDEVIISFAQIYRKTRRNMDAAGHEFGFTWSDPAVEEKLALERELVAMARANGMKLSVCSQRPLVVEGAMEARCVDGQRLSDVAGRPIVVKVRGNRPDCACHASRDIGEYDTCPHGCAYCYAVSGMERAKERRRRHDPAGEFLFPP